MGFNYAGIAETALRQIKDKGRDVNFIYKTTGSLDIDNDRIIGGSTRTETIKSVSRDFTQREIDGTLIVRGDKEFMIAAEGVEKPQMDDLIVDGEDQFSIKNIVEIKPGDTPLIYKLQARR